MNLEEIRGLVLHFSPFFPTNLGVWLKVTFFYNKSKDFLLFGLDNKIIEWIKNTKGFMAKGKDQVYFWNPFHNG